MASDDHHVIEKGIPLVNKEEGGEHWVLTAKAPYAIKRNIVLV
jgi:hypothetical protein